MKMHVLQGFIDTGGQANRYAQALRMQGCKSESWLYSRPLTAEPFNRLLDFTGGGLFRGRLRKVGYFLEALAKFNVWHIHKGFSMFHNATDLAWGKKLGKSVIIHYRGREIRPEMMMQELPAKIVHKVKRESEIADLVFVKDGQLASLIAPYINRAVVFPNIVKVDDFVPQASHPIDYFDSRRKLRIIHIPSNPLYKGTADIRTNIEKLRDKIEYREITRVPRAQLLEEYWKADIVIDQLLTGTYGNSALEAMALGRCVINHLNPNFMAYEPEEPPIVAADRDNLAETIEDLCSHRETIWARGEEGRIFVDRHHTFSAVGKKLVGWYQKTC